MLRMYPRDLSGPSTVKLTKHNKLKFKKRLVLRFVHDLESDLINNVDICAFRVLNPRQ